METNDKNVTSEEKDGTNGQPLKVDMSNAAIGERAKADYETKVAAGLIAEDARMTFDCEFCGEPFDTPAQLRGHVRGGHNDNPLPDSPVRNRNHDKNRKERVGIGSLKRKLFVSNIPKGKHARWINDNWRKDPTRIQDALQSGWTFLKRDGVTVGQGSIDENTDMGDLISKAVGVNEDGTAITGYLMVIDQDLYDEDQAVKQKVPDKIDEAVLGGEEFKKSVDGHGYVPENAQYNPQTPMR